MFLCLTFLGIYFTFDVRFSVEGFGGFVFLEILRMGRYVGFFVYLIFSDVNSEVLSFVFEFVFLVIIRDVFGTRFFRGIGNGVVIFWFGVCLFKFNICV